MISGRNLLADRAATFSGIVGNEAALGLLERALESGEVSTLTSSTVRPG